MGLNGFLGLCHCFPVFTISYYNCNEEFLCLPFFRKASGSAFDGGVTVAVEVCSSTDMTSSDRDRFSGDGIVQLKIGGLLQGTRVVSGRWQWSGGAKISDLI